MAGMKLFAAVGIAALSAATTIRAAAIPEIGDNDERTSLVRTRSQRPAADRPAVAPVTVPAGNGSPVITDGIFTPGEWDDAFRIALSESVSLLLKEQGGVVFLGVRGGAPMSEGPSELSLAVPGGTILKPHVSAQLGEVVLPTTGPEPPWRYGRTSGWYANELRIDSELAERVRSEGKTPFEMIRDSSYPSEGIELAIRRSKLPGPRWLIRLWCTGFVDGRPDAITHPPAAAERTTDGWMELRLEN